MKFITLLLLPFVLLLFGCPETGTMEEPPLVEPAEDPVAPADDPVVPAEEPMVPADEPEPWEDPAPEVQEETEDQTPDLQF
ncbi:MAG: hypothetical protein JJU29_18530 [Verrucomicrobia bacterium]|nr:hypothetical protein [Verrucomicrobiota bacterium]MCH8512407.1 hypothetical protein [Kiritimatiellia bacterium]